MIALNSSKNCKFVDTFALLGLVIIMHYPEKSNRDRIATVLLEIGNLMMSSGANTERIRITLRRIASSWGYSLELMITHRALILTLVNSEGEHAFSKIKRLKPHSVNFSIVTDISHMSWNVAKGKWSIEQVMEEVERLKHTPHFKRWAILFWVGLSDLSFCYLFGGDIISMLITFLATSLGLFVRQETAKREMNLFVVIFLASLTASLISRIAYFIPSCTTPDAAFATSVLFLIPGVPLVNSITDLIDGNTQNGISRGINGLLISFSLALGLVVAKVLYSLFSL